MKFLGLRLAEHDSNITYTNNTKVKYYKSERDYQIKHHGYDNFTQWTAVIKKWKINPNEIDAIGIVIDYTLYPWIKCDGKELFENIDIPLFRDMGFDCPIIRVDHHYAHFLSTWTSGEKSDVGFIFDGFGDDNITHTLFKSDQRVVSYTSDTSPSLGRCMGTAGLNMGLSGSVHDYAGKVMALKGYGRLSENDINNKKILHRLSRFNINFLDMLWNVDCIPRLSFDEVCDHVQLCHEVSEEIYLKHFSENSEEDDVIFYSGGVALNTIINSRLKKIRKNLYIPPHCNDEGLSLGVVELLRMIYEQESFDKTGFPYWQDDERPKDTPTKSTIKEVANLLSQGKMVGWYQGNGEIGPRALGNRSILMNPLVKNGKDIINKRVKNREWFRPFGASVLEEKTSQFFDWDSPSPYMQYVMDVFEKDDFPSITHVDGTCRIQTVSQETEIYYDLISEFETLTGVPMLLNTSLNNGGKPICGTINDALELFYRSDLDVLVVGDRVYQKS